MQAMQSGGAAETQSTFDLGSFLRDQGGAVVNKVNDDGSAQVILPDGSAKQFNTSQFLQDHGIDPKQTKIQYNDPTTALHENPIGFADGLALAHHSQKGQQIWLQQKYGTDNVMADPAGGFKVNDKGVWKQANPGFLSSLAANSWEVGGAVIGGAGGLGVGAAIGGGIGSLIAPGPGTVAGMAIGGWMGELIGGSMGAAAATAVKQQGSDILNLNTQLDTKAAMETFGRETVNNLIWGSLFKGASAGLKAAGGLAADFFKPGTVDKVATAEFAEKAMPGTSRADWGTLIRTPEDAQAVMKNMKLQQGWLQSEANGQSIGEVSPLVKKTEQVVTDFMETAESKAQAKMGQGLKAITEAGHMNAQTDLTNPLNMFYSKLANLGVLEKTEAGQWMVKASPDTATAEHLPQIWDKNSLNSLNQILQLVQNPKVISETNQLQFGTARNLQRSLTAIMDNTGAFDNSGSLSRQTRAALQEFRFGIGEEMGNALKGKTVSIEGGAKDAATFWKQMNRDYATYRQYADQFGKVSQFGGDTQQISNAVTRMLGPKGAGLETAFSAMADAVGSDAKSTLQELQQLRAGQNLTDIYADQAPPGLIKGVKNRIADTVRGGVRRDLGPAANAERLGDKTVSSAEWSKAWENGVLSKMASTPAGKTAVEAQAHVVNFLNGLPMNARSALLSNGLALRQLSNAATATAQQQQGMTKQLMQLASQVTNPAGRPNGQ